jgi:hypothetical protein
VAQIRLKLLAVCVLLKYPVRDGPEIIEAGTEICEKFVRPVLIPPEVLHACETVENVSPPRLEFILKRVKERNELVYVSRILNPDNVGISVILIEFGKCPVVLPFSGCEAVEQHKILFRGDLSYLLENSMGRFIKTNIDDIPVLGE